MKYHKLQYRNKDKKLNFVACWNKEKQSYWICDLDQDLLKRTDFPCESFA